MNLTRRVSRAGAVLDRLPRPAPAPDRLPDGVAGLVLEGMRLCQERDQVAGDHERWRDLSRDVYYTAGKVALELDRLTGTEVPTWRVDAVEARRAPDVPVVERIQEMAAPELEPELPEAIQHEVQQAIDNRRRMRETLGQPTDDHSEWADELRRTWGRAL